MCLGVQRCRRRTRVECLIGSDSRATGRRRLVSRQSDVSLRHAQQLAPARTQWPVGTCAFDCAESCRLQFFQLKLLAASLRATARSAIDLARRQLFALPLGAWMLHAAAQRQGTAACTRAENKMHVLSFVCRWMSRFESYLKAVSEDDCVDVDAVHPGQVDNTDIVDVPKHVDLGDLIESGSPWQCIVKDHLQGPLTSHALVAPCASSLCCLVCDVQAQVKRSLTRMSPCAGRPGSTRP
jgi:hypothetical protein